MRAFSCSQPAHPPFIRWLHSTALLYTARIIELPVPLLSRTPSDSPTSFAPPIPPSITIHIVRLSFNQTSLRDKAYDVIPNKTEVHLVGTWQIPPPLIAVREERHTPSVSSQGRTLLRHFMLTCATYFDCVVILQVSPKRHSTTAGTA